MLKFNSFIAKLGKYANTRSVEQHKLCESSSRKLSMITLWCKKKKNHNLFLLTLARLETVTVYKKTINDIFSANWILLWRLD